MYEELIHALRCPDFGDVPCSHPECNYWSPYACKARVVITDAAAAIEELQAMLTGADKKQAYQHDRICELTAENEVLQKECKNLFTACSDCEYLKALEPKQRKLGRWEKAKPKGVVVYSDGYAECSSCHEVIWLGWSMNFCPHCGVQNRIIDPDDMAKMEVQDAEM